MSTSSHPIRDLLQAARGVGALPTPVSRRDFARAVNLHPQKIASAEAPQIRGAMSIVVIIDGATVVEELILRVQSAEGAQRACAYMLGLIRAIPDVLGTDDTWDANAEHIVGMIRTECRMLRQGHTFEPTWRHRALVARAWAWALTKAVADFRQKRGAYAPIENAENGGATGAAAAPV